MRRVVATVVRVTGTCNARYKEGDKISIRLDDACVDKERSGNVCVFALNSILANMSRIREKEKILASCPDPATGLGGNVVFTVVKEESFNDCAGRP